MHYQAIAFLALLSASGAASATNAVEYQAGLTAEARAADPTFRDFSAQRGESFYRSRHGGDWSCATCHTDSPVAAGRHAVTNKTIQPLAPAANPERFTSPEKIEKWFKRNCSDVLKRACTPREKGDFIAYILSVMQ